MKFKNLSFTLRSSILFIFISFFSVGILILIASTYYRLSNNLTFISLKLMDQISKSVYYEIVNVDMQSAEMISNSLTQLIHSDAIELKNSKKFFNYASSLLKPKNEYLVQLISWADTNGNVFDIERNGENSFSTQEVSHDGKQALLTMTYYNSKGTITNKTIQKTNYDPRQRPWYINAEKEGKLVWSDIFKYQAMGEGFLGTGVSSPVYDQHGKLKGVIFVGVRLDNFQRALNHISLTEHSLLFLVTMKGQVLATSKSPTQFDLSHHTVDINQTGIPGLSTSFKHFVNHKKNAFIIREGSERYVATFLPLPEKLKGSWMIGVLIPESDFISVLKKANIITISIGFIILLLGIIIVSKLVNLIVNPLKKIATEAEEIKHFHLDGDQHIHSRIKEIRDISKDIYSMKVGLRAFKKYVPADLVRQLIEHGEDAKIGGTKKQLAIFFSDIQDFTKIAEKMDPNELMIHICEYLDELSTIIDQHSGTIDKYIGDSIMAFWGAPSPQPFSCDKAAKAALACVKRSTELNEKWQSQGKPIFFTRIGLHLGDAIVGNLGSSHHLNYSAVSDAINVASRLEGINKIYGTQIIVSESVYQVIKNDFVLRILDFIAPKGKSQANFIYELLTENVSQLTFDFSAYKNEFEQGFLAYKNQQWDIAIQHFELCLKIFPKDTVATVFISRCHHFKQSPPAVDWNGAWLIDEK